MTSPPATSRLDALEARLASAETRITDTRARLDAAQDELAVLRILAAYS
ncbi:MAG: carbohydrate porin, partial [Dietzia sp.]|nr:carbohydrate porin [Dietzia sp.]